MDTTVNNNHSFNIKLACLVGIENALLIGRIHYFVENNKVNAKCLHDGKYWTYQTSQALEEIYPYMNASTIRRRMVDLEQQGWIESGNFNQKAYDKTKWYTLGPKFIEWVKSLAQNDQGSQNIDIKAGNSDENKLLNLKKVDIYAENQLFEMDPIKTKINNESLAQNDQGSKSLAQNDQSIVQNEQSIAQNDQRIVQNEQPIQLSNTYNTVIEDNCSSSTATVNSFPYSEELSKAVYTGYRMIFNKNPNIFQTDKLFPALMDERFTDQERIKIFKETVADIMSSDDDSLKTFRYFLGTIKGKMKDILEKREEARRKKEKEDNAIRAEKEYKERLAKKNNEPEDVQGSIFNLAEIFNMNKTESAPLIPKEDKKPTLEKGSDAYKRAQEAFNRDLQLQGVR